MTRYGKLFALAVLAGLPASSPAAEFSYSYLELMADVSKTENRAAAPLEDDAHGRLFGIVGSWEVFDSGTDQNPGIHLYTHERVRPEAYGSRAVQLTWGQPRPEISAAWARADSRAA